MLFIPPAAVLPVPRRCDGRSLGQASPFAPFTAPPLGRGRTVFWGTGRVPETRVGSAGGAEMVAGCSTRSLVGNIRTSLSKVWMTMDLAYPPYRGSHGDLLGFSWIPPGKPRPYLDCNLDVSDRSDLSQGEFPLCRAAAVKRESSSSGQALPFSLLRYSSFFMRCRNRPSCRASGRASSRTPPTHS